LIFEPHGDYFLFVFALNEISSTKFSIKINLLHHKILQKSLVYRITVMGLSNKYCHAELDSASTLDIMHRFRNEFGMTLRNELFGQPHLCLEIPKHTFVAGACECGV